MENANASNVLENKPEQKMKNGIKTKALFIKHFSLGDWELLNSLISRHNYKTLANAVRQLVRSKANERL